MQVRMIPVEAVFLRFPRLVRDLSTKLGKQVELELIGKDTELDRTVVDALGDPLVHLIRNSLDHGLEGPDERATAGKPATGTLQLSARHAGGNVVIEVRDDGRGIDPAKVAQKAVERGLITEDAVDDGRQREGRRAALPPRLLDRRRHHRHLRPRRRHGRGPHVDPRARRRGPHDLRARRGDRRADPPAADAGDHGRAARGGRRPPVRDPARPHRAHRPPGRPHGPLGRRQPHARHARRRAPDRRRLRALRRPAAPGRRVRGRRARRHRLARRHRQHPVRPARAGHPAAPPGGRRELRPVGRRGHVRRADRTDRRLRRRRDPPPPSPPPEKGPREPSTPNSSSTPCASWPTSAPGPRRPRSRACSGGRSTSPCRTAQALPFAEAVEAAGDAGVRDHRHRARDRRRDERHRAAARAAGRRRQALPHARRRARRRVRPLRARRDRQHRRHVVHQRARLA